MEDWIAGAMLVLGSLLVLSGGVIIVLRALAAPGPTGDGVTEAVPATTGNRLVSAVRRMPAADRLIGWGVVLLVLGAVAAGAISFNLGASAGTR
ncbi:MAG TPA: hypothetical protein VFM55_16225 [Micromonosporaceae bacterium]|nr:hypothetical protein [Micromonosporaceae bacterium]